VNTNKSINESKKIFFLLSLAINWKNAIVKRNRISILKCKAIYEDTNEIAALQT
jgi:hypothetical protein